MLPEVRKNTYLRTVGRSEWEHEHRRRKTTYRVLQLTLRDYFGRLLLISPSKSRPVGLAPALEQVLHHADSGRSRYDH